MKKKKIRESAITYYKEYVEGEPLTQEVPIDCYIEGSKFILKKNKNNLKVVLKTLEPLQMSMISKGMEKDWLLIINSLRLCAGMQSINFIKKL